MKEKPKDKIESIVDALFESDQMQCTARYLTSGRRFAHLRDRRGQETLDGSRAGLPRSWPPAIPPTRPTS
jgi:hypothetical protein